MEESGPKASTSGKVLEIQHEQNSEGAGYGIHIFSLEEPHFLSHLVINKIGSD